MAKGPLGLRTCFLQACLISALTLASSICTPGDNSGNSDSAIGWGALPQIHSFQFDVPESGALSTTLSGYGANECNSGTVPESERLGDLALLTAARTSDGNCYPDPRYTHSQYLIEKGVIEGSDGTCVEAYRVHPHTSPATSFKACETKVYMNIPIGHKVFTFSNGVFAEIGPQGNAVDGMTDTGVVASTLTIPAVVFVAPADQQFGAYSVYHTISNTVSGAWVSGSPGRFSLEVRNFQVANSEFPATPHDPSVHWTYGPGDHSHTYQKPKEFIPVSRTVVSSEVSLVNEGVVWPDAETRAVYVTWFAGDLHSASTWKIFTPASSDEQLYAATSDGQSSIILLIAESQTNPPSQSTPGIVRVIKVDSFTGSEVQRVQLDAGSSELNFYQKFSSAASATWDPTSNTVAVMFSRRMTQASDGLNHQGCIAFLLDGTTLQIKQNLGQTSSHSWSNTIIRGSNGDFIGLDLGDNYPRGVNIHQIGQTSKQSKVVYTYKTRHYTGCTGDDVYYVDGDVSYCKRSNDNQVYTEIGHPGVVEVEDGLLVFFAGERPPLDNTNIGSNINAPRDIGFVKVSKDLQSILSPGATETGGFYNYGGNWQDQTNEGINFLTTSSSIDESASRLKTFKLSADRILLTFEVWTPSEFVRTEFMVVDANGGVVAERWHVCFPMRLAIADDGALIGGKAVAYAGGPDGRLIRYEICADTSCSGPGGETMPDLLDNGCPAPASMGPAPPATTTTATTTASSGFLAPTPAPTLAPPQCEYSANLNTAVKRQGTGGSKLRFANYASEVAYLEACKLNCNADPTCGGFVDDPTDRRGRMCKPKTATKGYSKLHKTFYRKGSAC